MSTAPDLSPVDVARHAAAYRLHSHASRELDRAGRSHDRMSALGITDAFSGLTRGGHNALASILQEEAFARSSLQDLLARPDDGSRTTGEALSRYERLRDRVQAYLDGLR